MFISSVNLRSLFGSAQGKPMDWATRDGYRKLVMKRKSRNLGADCHVAEGSQVSLWGRCLDEMYFLYDK
jgi:hypothetical protein